MKNTADLVRYNEARCLLLKACSKLARLEHRLACFSNPGLRYEPPDFPKTETLHDILREMDKLVAPTAIAQKKLDAIPEGTYADIIRLALQLGIGK